MNNQISTLSKVNKSPDWKARKRKTSEENRKYRAELNSQKSNAKGSSRVDIQQKIDEINKRGKSAK